MAEYLVSTAWNHYGVIWWIKFGWRFQGAFNERFIAPGEQTLLLSFGWKTRATEFFPVTYSAIIWLAKCANPVPSSPQALFSFESLPTKRIFQWLTSILLWKWLTAKKIHWIHRKRKNCMFFAGKGRVSPLTPHICTERGPTSVWNWFAVPTNWK